MRIGFTGTRSVPTGLHLPMYDFIEQRAVEANEFTTGACIGFDALAAAWLAVNRSAATHRLVIPANLSRVDIDIVDRFRKLIDAGEPNFVIEHMAEGTSYRDRNARILDYADEVIAVAEYPEDHPKSIRSGTWMTVRMARKRDLPVHLLVLSEL